jgi:hypothetical protein
MIDIGNWLSNNESCNAPHEPCGLFIDDKSTVPMKSRTVMAEIFAEHCCAEITEELAYVSDVDCTARFVFPLPSCSAIFR